MTLLTRPELEQTQEHSWGCDPRTRVRNVYVVTPFHQAPLLYLKVLLHTRGLQSLRNAEPTLRSNSRAASGMNYALLHPA